MSPPGIDRSADPGPLGPMPLPLSEGVWEATGLPPDLATFGPSRNTDTDPAAKCQADDPLSEAGRSPGLSADCSWITTTVRLRHCAMCRWRGGGSFVALVGAGQRWGFGRACREMCCGLGGGGVV